MEETHDEARDCARGNHEHETRHAVDEVETLLQTKCVVVQEPLPRGIEMSIAVKYGEAENTLTACRQAQSSRSRVASRARSLP